MKFQFHDSSRASHSESDWDTAIDMVTHSTVTENFLIKAEGGAIVHVWRDSNLRSSQYLEPDFDAEDLTGEIGSNVLHKDAISDRVRHEYGGGKAVSPIFVEPISVRDFEDFYSIDRGGLILDDKDHRICNFHSRAKSPEKDIKMVEIDTENDTLRDGYGPATFFSSLQFSETGIDAGMVEQIFNALPKEFGKPGGPRDFEFELPPKIDSALRSLGAKKQTIMDNEYKVIMENRAREARAKISIAILEMVHIHQHEMETDWDNKRVSSSP